MIHSRRVVLASALALAFSTGAFGQTVGVDGNPCAFTTVSAALAAVPTADDIWVKAGATVVDGNFGIGTDVAIRTGTSTCSDPGASAVSYATITGGGVLGPIHIGTSGDVLFEKITIADHVGGGGWGGNFQVDGELEVRDATVTGGSADRGGGFHVQAPGFLTLSGETVVLLNDADQGGGIHVQRGTVVLRDEALVMSNTAGEGGGISVDRGELVLEDTVSVRLNDANVNGGGIFLSGGSITTDCDPGRCDIDDNDAYAGGGIFSMVDGPEPFDPTTESPTISLAWVELEGNTSVSIGGAIASTHQLTLDDVLVTDNTSSSGSGGGVRVVGTVTITDSLFHGNDATYGGNLDLYDAIATIGDTEIREGDASDGGGIRAGDTDLTLTGVWIHDNDASDDGGGLFVDAGTTVDAISSWFDTNAAADDGGGIFVDDDAVSVDLDGPLGDGGCEQSSSGPLLANQYCSEVRGNTAESGGGLFVRDGTVDVDRTAFLENSATTHGAAIHLSNTSSGAPITYLTNVLVADNPGTTQYATVFVGSGTTLDARSVTVADNGGIPVQYQAGASGQFVRGIVWGNGANFQVNGLFSTLTADCTAFQAVTGSTTGPARSFGVNPLFVTTARGDYRLDAASSPSRDKCNLGPGVDLDSAPRPVVVVSPPTGTPFDRGAFEVQ